VFGWSRYEYIGSKAICTIQWRSSYTYAVAVIGLGVFVPFVVMIVAYTRIFSKASSAFSRLVLLFRSLVSAVWHAGTVVAHSIPNRNAFP